MFLPIALPVFVMCAWFYFSIAYDAYHLGVKQATKRKALNISVVRRVTIPFLVKGYKKGAHLAGYHQGYVWHAASDEISGNDEVKFPKITAPDVFFTGSKFEKAYLDGYAYYFKKVEAKRLERVKAENISRKLATR